jgi:hypothetical protein
MGLATSTMASSWAWDHGPDGAITTAGVAIASSVLAAVDIQADFEDTPVDVAAEDMPVDVVAGPMVVEIEDRSAAAFTAAMLEDFTVMPAGAFMVMSMLAAVDIAVAVDTPVEDIVVAANMAAVDIAVAVDTPVEDIVVAANMAAVDIGNGLTPIATCISSPCLRNQSPAIH